MSRVLYMVEMAFPFPEERAGFDAFYDRHVTMLLGIEGFLSGQRFEAEGAARAPLLAVYELADREVLARPSYTARAGPGSVAAEYRPKMLNWKRNLLEGPDLDLDLDVPMGGWLVVVDRTGPGSPPLPAGFAALAPIGLDRSVAERGIETGGPGDPPPAPPPAPGWEIRRLRPLHPRRTPE